MITTFENQSFRRFILPIEDSDSFVSFFRGQCFISRAKEMDERDIAAWAVSMARVTTVEGGTRSIFTAGHKAARKMFIFVTNDITEFASVS